MAEKIYLTQRTNRHVVKRLSSVSAPATYDVGIEFGTWGIPGLTVTTLNFPWGITRDSGGSIYVCDSQNRRIVKLDSNLAYLTSYDTSSTVGTPYAIHWDANGDLYVVGVELIYGVAIRIERLTTVLTSVRVSGNLGVVKDLAFKPVTICRGIVSPSDTFFVGGADLNIFETTETTSFSSFVTRTIYGEYSLYPELFANNRYNGMIKHSTNGHFYVNNGERIIKATASLINIGDSDFISKTIYGLKEGKSATMLIYNADDQKIMRFDENLNFVEDVYIDSGSVIATDAYEIMDFVEANV